MASYLELVESVFLYDARPELTRYYKVLVAAIETGTRRQRRLARCIIDRQLKVLEQGHPNSAFRQVRELIPRDCTTPHSRLLELVSTLKRRLVLALSRSVWWIQRSSHLSLIVNGETYCSVSFRRHLESIAQRLVSSKLDLSLLLFSLGLTRVGFFGSSKVDGRNIP